MQKTRIRSGREKQIFALLALLLLVFIAVAGRAGAAEYGGIGMENTLPEAGSTVPNESNDLMQGGRAGAGGAVGGGAAGAGEAASTAGTGTAWGVIIAVGLAALAVVLIFLFVPRQSEEARRGKRD